MSKERILCTGVAGFIYSHVAEYLANQGHEVLGIDNLSIGRLSNVPDNIQFKNVDLRDKDSVCNTVRDFRPTIVHHGAAWAHEGLSQFMPILITENNYNAYLNLLIPSIRYGVRRIVMASSMSVYGAQTPPFDESMERAPEDIYAIAKTSMEKATEVLADVHGFEYTIIRPHNCYSDDTEILTDSGWKLFADLGPNDLVATLNPDTERVEYHKPSDYQVIPYKGELFNFSSKSYDLCVTPEHRMWVKPTAKGGFYFLEAQKLAESPTAYQMRMSTYAKGWEHTNQDDHIIIPAVPDGVGRFMINIPPNGQDKMVKIEDWLEFLGYYLAGGSAFKTHSNYIVCITKHATKNKRVREKIVDVIKRMGFVPYEKDERNILIHSKQLFEFLRQLGLDHAPNKHVPYVFKQFSSERLRIIWHALMLCGGSHNGRRYSTISRQLCDDFTELTLKIGKSATVSHDGFRYRISVLGGNEPQIGNNRTKVPHLKMVPYDGYVYDVTVQNHIIFVRRNGKACWSSNCYGPRQIIWDPYRNVVGIFVNRIMRGQPPVIYGDGEQTRAFSYIDDVAPYIAKAGFVDEAKGEIINVGPLEEYSINRLADTVIKAFGVDMEPRYEADRPREVKHAYCTNDKARRILGYHTSVTLEEGIKRMVEWARLIGPQEFQYLKDLELEGDKIPRMWSKKLM